MLIGNRTLPPYYAVLPRIGVSTTPYGLAVLKHFETQGVLAINPSQGISDSRNKFRSLQILASKGLRVPATVLTQSPSGVRAAIAAIHGMPAILKILQGTHGAGVMLVHTPASLESVLDTLRTLNQDVIIQEFLKEGAGRDFRVFVVGSQVIATMMRTPQAGEFRSNIHRGGEGDSIELPESYTKAAIRAARAFGLQVAGVDLMESPYGPVVIEVNSSPGFEGIEKATGINVARAIIAHIKQTLRKPKRHR